MTFLKNVRFLCLDCEFTGLDLENDRIIEVAAVKFTFDEKFETYEKLVNPDCQISDESFAIHHISHEMLLGEPKIESILQELITFLKSGHFVGHGVGYDIEMIVRAAERAGINADSLRNRPIIDTLRLARVYGDSPNNSLESLAKHFNVPVDGAHRAMNDVVMNIEVFKHLVRRYHTLEQVEEVLSKPIKMKFMPLGKHKGRPFSEIPLQYLLRASHMDFDQDLLYSIRLELKKRKQGTGFSQAANPFWELKL